MCGQCVRTNFCHLQLWTSWKTRERERKNNLFFFILFYFFYSFFSASFPFFICRSHLHFASSVIRTHLFWINLIYSLSLSLSLTIFTAFCFSIFQITNSRVIKLQCKLSLYSLFQFTPVVGPFLFLNLSRKTKTATERERERERENKRKRKSENRRTGRIGVLFSLLIDSSSGR